VPDYAPSLWIGRIFRELVLTMLDIAIVLGGPFRPRGAHNISIPQIRIGISEDLVGVLIGYEQGDDLAVPGKLLQALWKAGIKDARLFPLDPPIRLGSVPRKPGPATVHLIIGQKT
jgi:hypothetical protein